MHTNDELSFRTVALCCCMRCAQTDRSLVCGLEFWQAFA